jgi:RNA polymerase sigma-70 factor, ECF subfamily
MRALESDLISALPRDAAPPLAEEVVALFDLLRDRLLRYVLSFGLPAADCEELVQETFLALFHHLQRGRSRENLRGWLFRVAHNLALRKRKRSKRDSAGIDAAVPLIDPAENPEDQMQRYQTHRRLQSVLKALPEQDQRCLVLRAEGLRYREIAGVLDMSLGAVSISIARSLERMERAIR